MRRVLCVGFVGAVAVGCGSQAPSGSSESLGTTSSALSTAQCQYFETNGKTTICHATSSATNPYVLIKVSESACINGHAGHPGDFIDVNGGTCNGAACLPETAPCDPTLPCCGNLSCVGGACTCPSGQTFCDVTCVDLTSDPNNCGGCGTVCATGTECFKGACTNPCVALDQCHVAGTPDPTTGVCSNPPAADGTACDDGNACTQTDSCQAGNCVGANPVVCAAQDECHVPGVCAPTTGSCSNPPVADGTACDDYNPCTQTDSCQAGNCAGANPVVCAAQDECHVPGVCVPWTGSCTNPAAPDGTVVSGGTCSGGTLYGGPGLPCIPNTTGTQPTCQANLTCVNGTCTACGYANQSCCSGTIQTSYPQFGQVETASVTSWCRTEAGSCGNDGTCQCGVEGYPCCGSTNGQPGVGGTCGSNLSCEYQDGAGFAACVCGFSGEACCGGSTCYNGSSCVNGTCS
jgi:hypothetical protein